MKNLKKNILILPIITAVLSIVTSAFFNNSSIVTKNIGYNDFLNKVNEGTVEKIYSINSPQLKIKLKDGTLYSSENPRSENFKESMLSKNVEVSESTYFSPIEAIPPIIFVISIVTIILLSLKRTSKVSSGNIKSATIDAQDMQNIDFNFTKVAGNEEAKESLNDIVDFLKNPQKYASYGARMPKGIILYGSPGTGKTLLAKAVAGEAGVPFYAVSGSDFVQVYVGVGAGRIRNLFKKAKSHGKAVIFIDEIDAIGKKRSSSTNGGSEEKDQTLNALLTEMSGFKESDGIIVIAATNRLDILDPALLRPGRFDRHIEVSLPDLNARKKILDLHFKNKPNSNIDIETWAKKTAYFSGAKLENFVNEAAILACKENSPSILDLHLDKAFSMVLAGYEKQDTSNIKKDDKIITAYHEAGHALISHLVLPNEKISKITIIPTSKGAGGYTLTIPEDNQHQNKSYLINRIKVLLGGRAAEELIFGSDNITTGAFNDLQRSTELISNMITQYGMGDSLGLLNMNELSRFGITTQNDAFKECKDTIDSIYKEVLTMLQENKEVLQLLTNELIEKETLYENTIENLL